MISLAAYPLCAKRLEFQKANLNEEGFNAYWAAVSVASELNDEKLAAYGGFNFDLRTEANGYKLLGRLEQFIKGSVRQASKAKSDVGGLSEAEVSVRAFLGANGVKVSRLNGLSDFWTAAMTLWPGHVLPSRNSEMADLRFQISKIAKKQRSKMAHMNVSALPATWRAR
jgi:hypothetical protein